MPDIDPTLVDPSVTREEIEQAIDGDPAPFPDVDVQDDLDDADPADGKAFMAVTIVAASKAQRIVNARNLRERQTFVGVGLCLAVVHGPILNIPALYPTAAIAGNHSKPFHPITDPASTQVPRAAIGFAWNGRAGHVWLELGGGLVSTTDFHRNGYEGVALRSRMLTWCGAIRWGWGESVNDFDVWPEAKKPAPKPQPWDWHDRVHLLEQDLARMEKDHASHNDIASMKAWIARIKDRHQ